MTVPLPSPVAGGTKFPASINFRHPLPRNSWSPFQRMILCVLVKFYTNQWRDLAKIWNHKFLPELEARGFTHRAQLAPAALATQWHNLRVEQHPIYMAVNEVSDESYMEIRDEIEDISIKVNVTLKKGTRDIGKRHPSGKKKPIIKRSRLANRRTARNVKGSIVSLRNRESHQLSKGLRLNPSARPKAKPRLVYRFWNTNSQGLNSPKYFAAGMWASDPSQIPRPTLDQRIFDSLARTHFSKYEILSPFISTFDNPLSPLHRAATQGNNSAVSVIDVSDFDQELIFSAEEFLQRNTLLSHPSYKGWGEWLIWGDIPPSSIVGTVVLRDLLTVIDHHADIKEILQLDVIRSFAVNRQPLKRRLAAGPGQVNGRAGAAMGKLFRLLNLQLPDWQLESLAIAIAKAWRFGNRTKDFSKYLERVRAAYHSSVGIQDSEAVRSVGAFEGEDSTTETMSTCLSSRGIPKGWQRMVAVAVPFVNPACEGEVIGQDAEFRESRSMVDQQVKDLKAQLHQVQTSLSQERPLIDDVQMLADHRYSQWDQFGSDRARVNRVLGW